MKSKRYLAALLACAVSACTGADARTPSGRGAQARELEVQPVARLQDDTLSILARPEWLSVSPDGRFAIADISDKNVKLYDAAGRRVQTVGRPGHGPGEFVGLMTAQAYRDSLVGYDLNGARLSVFGPDGRYARALTFGDRREPLPFSVRVVDDSLFLLAAAVPGSAGRDLVALVRPDGSKVASFFNPAAYLGRDPKLIQRSMVLADAAGGVVFAALVGGDSVYAFDYQGRRLGAAPVDPQQPLVTTRTLLERNGGREKLGDGTSVTHGNRNVIGLVALDSGTVAMQVTAYDAAKGVDPLEGGTILFASVAGDDGMRTIARREMEGAVLGRDRQGRLLMMRYTSADADGYEVLRVTSAPARTAGRNP